MTKYCKQCGKLNENPLLKLCREHYYQEQLDNPKQTRIKIKQVSSKNKNTPAKFTNETKAEILARDKTCIICWDIWTDYHHAYFWANANRGENRNDVDQWVLLCAKDHHEIHHWVEWKGKLYRAKCIEYLITI